MTQKDYNRMAALVRQLPTKMTKQELVKGLVMLFTLDNPRFSEDKFIRACEKEGDTK